MNKSLRGLGCGCVTAAALAAAFPAHALTRADRIGTPMIVAVPVTETASAGSSTTVVVPGEIALVDRSVPDKKATIYEGRGPQWMNVDWGDTVLFTVRQRGVPDRLVKWKFNGLDNVVNFADIDPYARFANNVKIYVNQGANRLRDGYPV